MTHDHNTGDNPPTGHNAEPQARIYTWDQVQAMREEGLFPELQPGTVITDIPTPADFDHLNEGISWELRQDLPARRALIMTKLRSVAESVDNSKRKQHVHQLLHNLRAIFIDPLDIHMRDMAAQRESGTPAISVVYVADSSSTGRGVIPGAVTVVRTYAIGPEGGDPASADPNSRLLVLHHTTALQNREWTHIIEHSKELGHIAVVAAIEGAFPGGLPGLGKRK